ncbi:DAK2 domain-containing protein [Selenihalanaerobacter shriftii]|uniref:DhaL domain-containing protein n=1 Tax=Selenihalanaerobacter shriftii TaxID=142842 RepID=A0A1T4JJF4_9FIRM|nr:DAK2 domain-containing protein [Selenihalanaerobacter shriftii]SJZ30292.1 hypothetical protein SAMN02745118_00028 [Selenihalanaerobacter shriftii]
MKQANNKSATGKEEIEIYKLNGTKLKDALTFSLNYFANYKEDIDSLNVFPVPDGDTGTNMYLTLSTATNEIKDLDIDSAGGLLAEFTNGALMGARGNSGVILSQLLRGFSETIEDKEEIGVFEIAKGLENAAKRAYKGVMKPVEGTILTVARETGEFATLLAEDEDNIVEFLEIVVNKATESVNKTPELLSTLKEANVVDAGGKGYEIFLRGIYESFISDEVIERSPNIIRINREPCSKDSGRDLEYKYCTEFLINNTDISRLDVQEEMKEYGDSLLVVKGNEFVKVHIHSNQPGLVLEEALKLGSLTKIKIDNMEVESQERSKVTNIHETEDNLIEKNLEDRIGLIAVAAGDGIIELFEDLGVDYIVEGGQSMNPSTKDLLAAAEEVKTNRIIILPNNKNVISAAKQVVEVTDKEVSILPTKSIPQGVAAMMSFNPVGDFTEVNEMMEDEIDTVKTGQVTYAVRDSSVNDLQITKGDILGIIDGNIEVVNEDKEEVVGKLLDRLVIEDDFLVTIYTGKEVKSEEIEDLEERLNKKFKDLDIEIYSGGQPLYYYLISVE